MSLSGKFLHQLSVLGQVDISYVENSVNNVDKFPRFKLDKAIFVSTLVAKFYFMLIY